MLYRYRGINSKNKSKRGFIEAKDTTEALKKIKVESDLAIVLDLRVQIKNPIIKVPTEIIGKYLEIIENNIVVSKERKINRIKKKKEKILKNEKVRNREKVRGRSLLEKIGNLKNLNISRKKKIEIDEETYNDLVRVFGTQNITREKEINANVNTNVNTNTNEVKLIIESDKKAPKLRNDTIEKREYKEDKKLNWELFEQRGDSSIIKKHKKLKTKEKDIIMLTRRLQLMLESGISLVNSLKIMTKTKNKTIRYVLNHIIEDLQSGSSFSESISKFPNQFDYTYIALVSIGETSGNMNTILLDIIESKEQKQKVDRKIKTASIYPSIIGVILIIILVMGSIVFIPTFEEMFSEQGIKLPLVTIVVFELASMMPIITGSSFGLIVIIKIMRGRYEEVDKTIRKYTDKIKIKITLVKNIMLTSYMYSFSYTVAMMIKSGIRLKDALTLSQKTIDNIYIKNEIEDIYSLIIQGSTFSEAMEKQEHFDEMIINIVLTGEESGQLHYSLSQIAKFYQDELNKQIDRMIELVQPLSILLIALIVIPVIFAIYLPILDISSGSLLDL